MEKTKLIALCGIMLGTKGGGNVAPGEVFSIGSDEGTNLVKRSFARELTDAEAKADALAAEAEKAKGKAPAQPLTSPAAPKAGDEKKP